MSIVPLWLAKYFSPQAKLKHALNLIEDEEYFAAFPYLSAAATAGIPQAQYLVGKAYLDGRGVPPSLEEGARWMQAAAQGGWVAAQSALASLYLFGIPKEVSGPASAKITANPQERVAKREPDFRMAAHWAKVAAQAGSVEAQALYGYILSAGPEDVYDLEASDAWYKKAAEAGSSQGCLGHGLALLRHSAGKDEALIKQAISFLEKADAAGLLSASYLLGMLAERGSGMDKSPEISVKYYKKAAEGGVRAAQARYGLALYEGWGGLKRSVQAAETWLRKAALAGDMEAAALLGDINVRGDELPPSYVEAARWYRHAADLGHPTAPRALALMYRAGKGVDKDEQEAARWLRLAVERGDRVAAADLGNLMLQEKGAQEHQDERRITRERFEKAAKEGDMLAAFNYAVCLAEGVGIERNPQEAARWMFFASEKVVNAQYWYGRMLLDGFGVEKNPEEGRLMVKKAADAGMSEAQVVYAGLLVEGIGGYRDHYEARDVYVRAVEAHDNVNAMFSLGALYGGGHDIEQDRVEAQAWFARAAQRGHGMAQLMLGKYLRKGLGGEVNLHEARQWLLRAQEQGIQAAAEELAQLDQQASGGE